ncbi:MAG: hypothetical protein IPG47_17590 [Thermoflexaceae bacterium]|nr:hypothetical protein [Thermoflexaceae bacterium]
MAQYTVEAACGHTASIQLYGPEADRSRRIAWMKGPGGQCNDCYAAYKRTQEAAAAEAEIEQLAATLRAQSAQITPDVAATLRAQSAAGKGTPAKREAVARVLAELGL